MHSEGYGRILASPRVRTLDDIASASQCSTSIPCAAGDILPPRSHLSSAPLASIPWWRLRYE
jgi:hypothetical protein